MFTGVLSTEEVLTAVETSQWILLSVIRWEGELVVEWNTEIIIVIVGGVMGVLVLVSECWNW